ncbi:hypothetical protein KG089_05055 [Carnobacteriaceae bacterium zg-ZUI252]|nr:hypothetical protein [Carnobacteriaceae bacterium zg-ZUI252]MBS4770182.1 hypothetical protein [Carnobacteriaceae bacterium zg-ZUI240]QTU82774.1 hypothetical protein J7S27_05750 [Carnobacteriaceae bacterium zg-C25]
MAIKDEDFIKQQVETLGKGLAKFIDPSELVNLFKKDDATDKDETADEEASE